MVRKKQAITPELKALAVLFVFVIFGPIAQVSAYIIALQDWAHIDNFFASLWTILKAKIFPAVLPGYGQYMPPCFLTAWYFYRVLLKKGSFSFFQVIIVISLSSLAFEILTQALMVVLGAPFHLDISAKMLWLTIIQGLVSGIFCGFLCQKLSINKVDNQQIGKL